MTTGPAISARWWTTAAIGAAALAVAVSRQAPADGGIAGVFDGPPPNDDCCDAVVVCGNPYDPAPYWTGDATIDTCDASSFMSCASAVITNRYTVWYSFTPPTDGIVRIDTEGSDYDTGLSVWDDCGEPGVGGGCLPAVELACDDNGGSGLNAMLLMEVEACTTYMIRVENPTGVAGGTLDFNLLFTTSTPTCDEDLDGDGSVATTDLLQLLGAWGSCSP